MDEPVDKNLILAVDRTILARERSYAAWMRTGLAALAAGVGARTLLNGHLATWLAIATSAVLIVFSAFCFLAAVWRELSPGFKEFHPDERRLPSVLLVGVSGFLTLVAAALLVGMAIAR